MIFNDEGESNKISFNEEHPSKANFPIFVTDEGIDIFLSDEQFLKETDLINSKEDGISNDICSKLEHPMQDILPIFVIDEETVR